MVTVMVISDTPRDTLSIFVFQCLQKSIGSYPLIHVPRFQCPEVSVSHKDVQLKLQALYIAQHEGETCQIKKVKEVKSCQWLEQEALVSLNMHAIPFRSLGR